MYDDDSNIYTRNRTNNCILHKKHSDILSYKTVETNVNERESISSSNPYRNKNNKLRNSDNYQNKYSFPYNKEYKNNKNNNVDREPNIFRNYSSSKKNNFKNNIEIYKNKLQKNISGLSKNEEDEDCSSTSIIHKNYNENKIKKLNYSPDDINICNRSVKKLINTRNSAEIPSNKLNFKREKSNFLS